MSIWIVGGMILLVESIVLVWMWALCRAAALADRRLTAALPATLQSIRVHPALLPRDAWRRAAVRHAARG